MGHKIFQRTLKDRLKVMRGLKSEETAEIILSGWFIFYNFIRPHESLKGKTPAEAVGLDLGLKHKWHELIELATIHQVKS